MVDKGYIYRAFNNPVYIGVAAYKGQHFPGEHQAIVGQEFWDRVKAHLKSGRHLDQSSEGAHHRRPDEVSHPAQENIPSIYPLVNHLQ